MIITDSKYLTDLEYLRVVDKEMEGKECIIF